MGQVTRASDRQVIYVAGDMIARLSGSPVGGASGLRLKIAAALGDARHIFRICANDGATWRLEFYIGP
ncbi:MAG: hypothetical protein ABI459_08590, partial [Deltaproteobacteria bacterium]